MAAGAGIAPASAELQSAAHLSEPSGDFVEPGEIMVPLRGDAPRSSGYQPGALLLSYRGGRRSTRESHSGRFERRSGFRDRFLVYAGRAPWN